VNPCRSRNPGQQLGALFRRSLLFRPTLPLRCSDPGSCLGTEGALATAWFRAVDCMAAGQKCAGLLETGNLGIDFGNQLGCVHAGQCNPERLFNLATTAPIEGMAAHAEKARQTTAGAKNEQADG